MIRATTGGVLKSYRANLMNSFINQNKARDTVLSQRVFNSYADDPAAAAKAFRLRKARMTVESQYTICNSALSKYQAAFTSLDGISKLIDTQNGTEMNTLKETTLRLLNDPEGDARTQLNKALDQLSETIVQNMNQKYGENFVFAGADGHNVPFEVKDYKLYYRGVPVDASEPELFDADGSGAQVKLDANGNVDGVNGTSLLLAKGAKTISVQDYDNAVANAAADPTAEGAPEVLTDPDGTTPHTFTDADGNDYYIIKDGTQSMTQAAYDTAVSDAAKLKYLVNETQYVDIGLGFQEDNGNLIPSSAFDAALNGLTFLGYGLDEDGDPKNIYSLVQRMREIANNVPEEGVWDESTYEEFRGLVLKLEDASSEFKTQFTNLTASTTKLENNAKLLEENHDTLQLQYSDLEDVDMADAITSFLWASYCYNAALKVGNSVLSESLMDYLS